MTRIKNGELYEFIENVHKLNTVSGKKLIKAIIDNKKLAEDEIEKLENVKEESDKIKELNQKITERYMFYTDKNPDGSPKMIKAHNNTGAYNEKPSISKPKQLKLEKDIKKLKEDYKEVIEEYQKAIEDYGKKLDEFADVKFKTVKIDDLPDNIELYQYEILSFMVED